MNSRNNKILNKIHIIAKYSFTTCPKSSNLLLSLYFMIINRVQVKSPEEADSNDIVSSFLTFVYGFYASIGSIYF